MSCPLPTPRCPQMGLISLPAPLPPHLGGSFVMVFPCMSGGRQGCRACHPHCRCLFPGSGLCWIHHERLCLSEHIPGAAPARLIFACFVGHPTESLPRACWLLHVKPGQFVVRCCPRGPASSWWYPGWLLVPGIIVEWSAGLPKHRDKARAGVTSTGADLQHEPHC